MGVILELCLVVSLISILSGLSAPYCLDWFRHHQLLTEGLQLQSAIQYARMQAMMLRQPVTFCGSSDRKNCDGNWSAGWLLKTEAGHGGVLRRYLPLPGGDRLTWRGSFGRQRALTFISSGETFGQQGSFELCDLRRQISGSLCQRIIVLHTGSIRAVNDGAKF